MSFLQQILMNVMKGVLVVLNYALTLLVVILVHVIMVINSVMILTLVLILMSVLMIMEDVNKPVQTQLEVLFVLALLDIT